MKRCLLLVAFFTVVASLPSAILPQAVGVSTVAASPNTPPTPEAGPPPADTTSPAKLGKPDKPAEEPPLDCTTSPFGRLLMVGGEKEFFVGYSSYYNSTTSGLLEYRRFDMVNGGALVSQTPFNGATLEASNRFTKVADVRGVAADLNGDGQNEYVQAMRDGSNNYSLVTSSRSRSSTINDTWRGTYSTFANHDNFAVTAGNLVNAVDSTTQQVAVASNTSYNSIRVQIWSGSPNGGILQDDNVVLKSWEHSPSGTPHRVADITAADLNGDGFDELVLATVLDLDRPGSITLFTLKNVNNAWTLSGSTTLETSDNLFPQIKAGDVDGDFKDEIVVAYSQDNPANRGFGLNINVKTLKFNGTSNTFVEYGSYLDNSNDNQDPETVKNLTLAIGDTDKDGLPEPAITYWENGYLFVDTLDAEQPIIVRHNRWMASERSNIPTNMALDVGDINANGFADIALAYVIGNGSIEVMRFEDQLRPSTSLLVRRTWTEPTHTRGNLHNLTLHFADWDNNSIKAAYEPAIGTTLQCDRVTEPQISAAVFAPPTWRNIQPRSGANGAIGRSQSLATSQGSAYTTEHTHSVSGYIGGEVDAAVAEIAVRVTAGSEWSNSQTRSNSTTETVKRSEGWNNSNDYVIADITTYKCYSYQLRRGQAPADGAMRFCAIVPNGVGQEAPALDIWDTQYSPKFVPNALQWAPVVRDWTSLTHFRGASAVQSSTQGAAVAARAADSNTDGVATRNSVSTTAPGVAGNTAWWQIDLGTAQEISKIRVWNRTDNSCAGQPCGHQLKNFYVFASDVDFRTIPNSKDPNVLRRDGRVVTQSHSGIATNVTTFVTIDDTLRLLKKRFIRVQLAGAGPLSLAEVQVLGTNHVEPHRYPIAINDPVPGDGWFLTTLYDPQSRTYKQVRNRGNLLWNGVEHDVLSDKVVGPGEGVPEWSLSTENVKGTTEATSYSNSFSVGAEFEVAAGLFTKATVGGSYSFSTGLTEEHSSTVEWGTGFEIGGSVTGFPNSVGGKTVVWPNQCKYKFQPYYYEMTEKTSLGVEHRFTVIDYIVPTYLDRNGYLTPCLRGTSSSQTGLVLSPASLQFGNQLVNTTSAVKTVTLTNYTSSAIRIHGIGFTGTTPSAYQQTSTCPVNSSRMLASFESCTISVRFRPSAMGTANARLSVTTNATGAQLKEIPLFGTGIAPVVSLSHTSANFGHQQIATTSRARTVTLKNTGTGPLTISAMSITGPFVHTRTCPVSTASLAPGASCTIRIFFRPTAKGVLTGALTITDNASGSPRRIALGGIGASIGLSPTSLAFGTQVLNTASAARQVTITNNGTVPLPLVSLNVTGPRAAAFVRTHTCPANLAAGAKCVVSISFKPTTSGAQTATLNVVYNTSTAPRTVALGGTGTTLSVAPSTLNFGNLKVGTASAVKTVTLANRGTTAIALGAQTLGGTHANNFARSTTCGASLAVNTSCTISVRFTPTATGAKTAVLSIANNAAGNPRVVSLSGNGTP